MGTVNYTVSRYAPTRGQSPALMETNVITSDVYTSTTIASYIEDGSGDITFERGTVLRINVDEPAWIRFSDFVAAVGDGFHLAASVDYEFECTQTGKVSIIDVS